MLQTKKLLMRPREDRPGVRVVGELQPREHIGLVAPVTVSSFVARPQPVDQPDEGAVLLEKAFVTSVPLRHTRSD